MTRKSILVLAAALAAGGIGYGGYRLGALQAPAAVPTPAPAAQAAGGKTDPKTGRPVLYWHDPMVPGPRFEQPGKSPFMDMDLVPVYADEAEGGGVKVAPQVQQSLGLRTALVAKGPIAPRVQAVGSVAWNERGLAVLQARAAGFVERLHVRAPLEPVRRGQPLVDLLAPDWVAAQEEYLWLLKREAPGAEALREAARQRLLLAGMTEAQIRAVEAGGKTLPRLTVVAPLSGVVAELAVREGMTVMPGAPLFRINDLSSVWVNAEVPEAQAALVRPGQPVEARTAALPDTVFQGKVSALLPEVDAQTRTLKARIELANPGGRLVPGMYATIAFGAAAAREALLVPTEAVIRTGKRDVVITLREDGRFAPADVQLGLESDGHTEIRQGLAEGARVVLSGQFLIDSEASLKSTLSRLETGAPAEPKEQPQVHRGEAKVEALDAENVTLSHGPIPSIGWGAMTMGFQLAAGMKPALRAGDRVAFEFRQAEGGYEIVRIERMGGGK